MSGTSIEQGTLKVMSNASAPGRLPQTAGFTRRLAGSLSAEDRKFAHVFSQGLHAAGTSARSSFSRSRSISLRRSSLVNFHWNGRAASS